jgi:hypothetical protein
MTKARIGENVPLITKQVDASIVISRERINTLRERERETHTHVCTHMHNIVYLHKGAKSTGIVLKKCMAVMDLVPLPQHCSFTHIPQFDITIFTACEKERCTWDCCHFCYTPCAKAIIPC